MRSRVRKSQPTGNEREGSENKKEGGREKIVGGMNGD
jgi:hypothetical protein